jgi:hypothetical protein
MLEVRGYFYGKIKHAMPTSDRFCPKGEKLWSTTGRTREGIATEYGSYALSDRESWRFIVSHVYERDGVTLGRVK